MTTLKALADDNVLDQKTVAQAKKDKAATKKDKAAKEKKAAAAAEMEAAEGDVAGTGEEDFEAGMRQNAMERDAADADNDGKLDFGEFCQFVRDREEGEFSDAELKKRFDALDEDGSGELEFAPVHDVGARPRRNGAEDLPPLARRTLLTERELSASPKEPSSLTSTTPALLSSSRASESAHLPADPCVPASTKARSLMK